MCENKICRVCGEDKPLDNYEIFHNKLLDKTYHKNMCKKCDNKVKMERRKSKPKIKTVRRSSVTLHCMAQVRARFTMESKIKGFNIDYSFMTVDWFNKEVEKCNNTCGICGRSAEDIGRRLVIDHSHVTGKYRGLLCGQCNQGLGSFGDNIEGVIKAITYLDRVKE